MASLKKHGDRTPPVALKSKFLSQLSPFLTATTFTTWTKEVALQLGIHANGEPIPTVYNTRSNLRQPSLFLGILSKQLLVGTCLRRDLHLGMSEGSYTN